MLTEARIKKAIAGAQASGRKSIELKDDGERGVGRLTLLIRPSTDRVTAEWYAVWYRAGRRASTKIANYPMLSLADARRKFREDFAPAISTGASPVGSHARRRREERGKVTVKRLFEAYVTNLRRSGKRSADNVERILLSETAGAALLIGSERPAAEIEASDIVPVLSRIHDGGPS